MCSPQPAPPDALLLHDDIGEGGACATVCRDIARALGGGAVVAPVPRELELPPQLPGAPLALVVPAQAGEGLPPATAALCRWLHAAGGALGGRRAAVFLLAPAAAESGSAAEEAVTAALRAGGACSVSVARVAERDARLQHEIEAFAAVVVRGRNVAAGCRASDGGLVGACEYSFGDLFRAAHPGSSAGEAEGALAALYAGGRDHINPTVAEWATAAGWFTELQSGDDGAEYMAFSPRRR